MWSCTGSFASPGFLRAAPSPLLSQAAILRQYSAVLATPSWVAHIVCPTCGPLLKCHHTSRSLTRVYPVLTVTRVGMHMDAPARVSRHSCILIVYLLIGAMHRCRLSELVRKRPVGLPTNSSAECTTTRHRSKHEGKPSLPPCRILCRIWCPSGASSGATATLIGRGGLGNVRPIIPGGDVMM